MSDSHWAVEVRITPRGGILDPEGETIARALRNLGHDGVSRVRAGRLIRMRVAAPSADEARRTVTRMCEELIANPVIEDYEVRVLPEVEAGQAGASAGRP